MHKIFHPVMNFCISLTNFQCINSHFTTLQSHMIFDTYCTMSYSMEHMHNTAAMAHGYYDNYNDSDVLAGLSNITI